MGTRDSEIKEIIGQENLKLLYEEIDNGHVGKIQIQQMALKMGGRCHGVFQENKESKHRLMKRLSW